MMRRLPYLRAVPRLAQAVLLALTVLGSEPRLHAEPPPSDVRAREPKTAIETLTYDRYLSEVVRKNLDVRASRAAADIATAQVDVARVFPDPQLTVGLAQADVSGGGNPTASLVQLAVPLQVGGQRAARVEVAEAEKSAALADLSDSVRAIRADAADAFVEALRARSILERRRRTLASLEGLVAVNKERLRVGDVGEAALVQSRVEAEQARAQVVADESLVRTTELAAAAFLGEGATELAQGREALVGDLASFVGRALDEEALVRTAQLRRPDLDGAKKRLEAAGQREVLARRNRVPDVTLGATWMQNFPVSSNQTPGATLLGGTVTVNLPFSRVYRGDLDAARASVVQSQMQTHALRVRVELEVRAAVTRYRAASERARIYDRGVLRDADDVLDRTMFNYRRGGATLVEVLVAQRTANDAYLAYFDALADAAHTWIDVERATGAQL